MKIDALKNSNNFKSSSNLRKKNANVSNSIENNSSNYFQTATNTSNINQGLINTKNNLSFKGNLTTFTKKLISNADIPKGCLDLDCHDAHLDGSISLKKIIAKAKEAFFDSESATGHVELNDSVSVDEVNAESILMSGCSKLKKAVTKYLAIIDSASSEVVHSSNVELKNQSNIRHIVSEENLTLYGQGTIGDIECQGNKIFITGPIEIKGKIKFNTPDGEVHVLKNRKNESAIINADNIENGTAQYQVKTASGGKATMKKRIFDNSLNQSISEITAPDPKIVLGGYKSVASIIATNCKKALGKLKLTEAELIRAELLYNEFAQNTLLTIADTKNSKRFTQFWVKNKTIGNENLTDFWLKSLAIKPDLKTAEEKAKILNNLSAIQKQKLIKITAEHWVNAVLPKQMAKIAKTDILGLQAIKTGEKLLELLKQGRAEDLQKILTSEGIEKLKTVKCGDKPLIDFWIDTIDGEGSAKAASQRLNENRLKEIFGSENSVEKIYQATIDESRKISEQIKKTSEAYSNLINSSELDDVTKALLKEYQNNELFSLIVAGNAKDATSMVHLELSTKSILDKLKFEKEKAIKDSADDLFNPLRDHNYLSQNADTPELENKISLIMTVLKEKIQLSPTAQAEELKRVLANFSSCLRQTDENTLSAWTKLVDQAQEYFENVQVSRVVDANIESMYTVQKTLKDTLPTEVRAALNDKNLTTVQKEFIARYKNDNNLLNLLKKAAVKRDEDINGLIATEQMNNSVFDNLSHHLRKNISPEITASMPEMTDFYIKLLGVAPNTLSNVEKYKLLSKIPDEELELIGESVKDYWSKNFLEKTMSDRILGKVRNVDAGYQSAQMSQQLKDLSENITNDHNQIVKLMTQASVINHAQLTRVIDLLSQNNAQSKEMSATLMVMLDKIQANYPQYAAQCKQARTTLQKLKDGLFNTSSMASGTSIILAIKGGALTGGAAGGPVGAAAGALLMPLLIIGSNLKRSFSKA